MELHNNRGAETHYPAQHRLRACDAARQLKPRLDHQNVKRHFSPTSNDDSNIRPPAISIIVSALKESGVKAHSPPPSYSFDF